jgi:hypothetical protein
MGLSNRIQLLLAGIESVEGVAETLDETTHAIKANEITVTPNPDIVRTAEFTSTLDAGRPLVGGVPMTIGIQVYCKGSGVAGTPPEVDPLLQACGFTPTVTGSPADTVTYDLVSSGIPSITIYTFLDGTRRIFSGCRGTLNFTATTRQFAVYDFSFTGRGGDRTDDAAGTATFDVGQARPFRDGLFTIGGDAGAIQQFTWALNNTVALPDDPNEVDGFQATIITARDIQGTMNPQLTDVATRDVFGDLKAGNLIPLVARSIVIAGETWRVNIPNAAYTGETPGDRDSLAVIDVPFSAVSVDDGVQLVFT